MTGSLDQAIRGLFCLLSNIQFITSLDWIATDLSTTPDNILACVQTVATTGESPVDWPLTRAVIAVQLKRVFFSFSITRFVMDTLGYRIFA
jgi:hypothetical protein